MGLFFFAETAEQEFCKVMSNKGFFGRDMRPLPFTKATINSHEKRYRKTVTDDDDVPKMAESSVVFNEMLSWCAFSSAV